MAAEAAHWPTVSPLGRDLAELNVSGLLLRGVNTAVVNTVVALFFTSLGHYSFASNLVHSYCIGTLIWLLIEAGRNYLIQDWLTQWQRMLWLVPLSTVLAYFLGAWIAGALLGYPTTGYWFYNPRLSVGTLALSLVVGSVMTHYYFGKEALSRAREQAAQLHRQAADSRLKLLESQLEPHMLFNTLANLRALIAVDSARALTMLDSLIAYLRTTLSASRQSYHGLSEEFARLKDYLDLMAVRMGPRLRYRLELPPDLAAHPLPPLLLQPLVENSIKHGLAPLRDGGEISVSAQKKGNTLILDVRDTGAGFAATGDASSGFGMKQVQERLQTAYGSATGLQRLQPEAPGCWIRLTLPMRQD